MKHLFFSMGVLGMLLAMGGCGGGTDAGTDGGEFDGGPMDSGLADGGSSGADAGDRADGGSTPDGSVTIDGGASTECPGAQLSCDGACADVSSDETNCGRCGMECGASKSCVAGTCGGTATCPAGTVDCGGECRDVSADPEFCGSCVRMDCRADQVCADGACTCRPGLSACGGACVDTAADPAHCGGCDAPCDRVCTAGVCGARAACTFDVCDGACVDTETDPANCGGCGDVCDVDQVCVEGSCEDYEPAPGCASCGGCETCPFDAFCCELPGYGASCLDVGVSCP